jgi:hypothetical protein
VNQDSFAQGEVGETNLIFPRSGEDNRLEAGRLIDIPSEGKRPFKATPTPNQDGELLTIIITSRPLSLPDSKDPLPISTSQLREWQRRWWTEAERYEMEGGVGQLRTRQEQLAAAAYGARQLTRDDPTPQTIYLLRPNGSDGVLFNVMLLYSK